MKMNETAKEWIKDRMKTLKYLLVGATLTQSDTDSYNEELSALEFADEVIRRRDTLSAMQPSGSTGYACPRCGHHFEGKPFFCQYCGQHVSYGNSKTNKTPERVSMGCQITKVVSVDDDSRMLVLSLNGSTVAIDIEDVQNAIITDGEVSTTALITYSPEEQ